MVRSSGSGALNGFLVWALSIVLILAFSALGVGAAFGAAGSAFAQYGAIGRGMLNGRSAAALHDGAGGQRTRGRRFRSHEE